MSLPSWYTSGIYRPAHVTIDEQRLWAVAAPGGQLVGRPDTYESRDGAKARADRYNDIREAMAPR